MTAPRHVAALDALAATLATALGVAQVTRETAFAQPTSDKGDGVRLMVSLPNGRSTLLAEHLGGARPYEVTHATRLLIGAVGGKSGDKRAAVEAAMGAAAAAIAADRSLGGLVDDTRVDAGDWQEVAEDVGPAIQGDALDLTLLITSETAIG